MLLMVGISYRMVSGYIAQTHWIGAKCTTARGILGVRMLCSKYTRITAVGSVTYHKLVRLTLARAAKYQINSERFPLAG